MPRRIPAALGPCAGPTAGFLPQKCGCCRRSPTASAPSTTDAPFGTQALEGISPGSDQTPLLGVPIDASVGRVLSAALHPTGLVAVIGPPGSGPDALMLQAMTVQEGLWRPSAAPVPVPAGPGSVPDARARLFVMGTHWMLVERPQRVCQSGADLCHPQPGGVLFHLGPGGWRAVGSVPVDITGSYGHPTCGLRHIGYDRTITSVSAETLQLRLVPARTRTLCDANTEGCTAGSVAQWGHRPCCSTSHHGRPMKNPPGARAECVLSHEYSGPTTTRTPVICLDTPSGGRARDGLAVVAGAGSSSPLACEGAQRGSEQAQAGLLGFRRL